MRAAAFAACADSCTTIAVSSGSAEGARALFEIGSGDVAVRRVHLVWLDQEHHG